MSKALWQMTPFVTDLQDTDLIYILRDPATGRFDRAIAASAFRSALNLSLDNLSDVAITAPVNGQALRYNGTAWVNTTAGAGGASILDELGDVIIAGPATGHLLRFNGAEWVNVLGTTHFSAAGHNHDANYQPLDADLTTIAGLASTTDNMIQAVAGVWASRTPAQVRTALGLVIGTNVQAFDADLSTLAGLTATTDNFIVSVANAWASRTPAQVRTTLGLVIGTDVAAQIHTHTASQITDFAESVDDRVNALLVAGTNITLTYNDGANTLTVDAAGGGASALDDLTDVVITAPSTGEVLKFNGTNWINDTDATGGGGGALNDLTDVIITAGAAGDILRHDGTNWVDAVGTTHFAAAGHNHDANYQPLDADLTTLAGLTPTTDNMIQSVAGAWASRTPAQVRTALALVPGTDVQAFDADLSTIAGLTPTTNNIIQSVAGAWASRTPAQVLAGLGLDADLATLALPASTTISAFAATILDDANGPAVLTTIGAAAASHSHTSLKERDYSVEGTLIVSTGVLRLPFKRAATITNVMATVGTAPTGAAILIDVNKNGTTIFTGGTNRPNIAVSTNEDLTAVPAVTAISAGEYLTVDIDQIGSTIAGADLVVTIEYTESIT